MDAHLPAEGLVHLLVAVDGGDLGDAGKGLGGLLVGGLEVLAVAAPWRVELDDLVDCQLLGLPAAACNAPRCSWTWQ